MRGTMPAVPNPLAYATPTGFAADGVGVRRMGSLLVVSKRAGDVVDLPPRCVRCNAPAERQWRHALWYFRPGTLGWLVLPIYGLLSLAICVWLFHRTANLTAGLCQAHWKARRRRLSLAALAVVLGLAVFATGIMLNDMRRPLDGRIWGPAIGAPGIVLATAGVVYLGLRSRLLWPVWIDADVACLNGAGVAFLDELPAVQIGASDPPEGTPYVVPTEREVDPA
jgi:hypothetical protein